MNQEQKQRITVVEKWKVRKGKSEYLKYLTGNVITARQAINAKCYECTCGYDSGGKDCMITVCPLYQFMPFRKTPSERKTRAMSEEHKEKLKVARQQKSKS